MEPIVRDAQKMQLSALFDGELEAEDARPLLKAVLRHEAAHAEWRAYTAIREVMRGEQVDKKDITANVMARIREEPVVLAPNNVRDERRHRQERRRIGVRYHPLMALAASVAGVMVVGWLAIMDHRQAGEGMAVASLSPAGIKSADIARVSTSTNRARGIKSQQAPALSVMVPMQEDISEYLMAHQTHSSSFRLGGTEQKIRSVSIIGNQAR